MAYDDRHRWVHPEHVDLEALAIHLREAHGLDVIDAFNLNEVAVFNHPGAVLGALHQADHSDIVEVPACQPALPLRHRGQMASMALRS